nr:hypothetical protein [uncultured bacterium]
MGVALDNHKWLRVHPESHSESSLLLSIYLSTEQQTSFSRLLSALSVHPNIDFRSSKLLN